MVGAPLLEIAGLGKMKFFVLLTLVSLAFSAPQPKKVFHENFEDFMDLIDERAGDEIADLMSHYIEYEEFLDTLDFMNTDKFKNLVYEMEALPEFRDVLDFLEVHNIDITYFVNRFNDLLENPQNIDRVRTVRHETSGRDFNSFIRDSVDVLPKAELAALFDQKVADDDDFRVAIESIQSDEWKQIFDALWASEVFQAEVKTLAENGIDIDVLLDEIVAFFGQN